MAAKYIALLTQVGAAKLANATALGKMLNITHMGVGDGGGNPTTPDLTQTALINEKRRAELNGLRVDPNNPNQIIAEQIIPENEGGFWLREIGLYDADGDLIAVANCPDTYKPQMQEGSGRVQTVRMILAISQTEAVSLKIDPAVVLASRQYVQNMLTDNAFALDFTDRVTGFDVPWDAKSGLYKADFGTSAEMVVHFHGATSSCSALQFAAHYGNRGLSYRTSRDNKGFEHDWEQFYTTGFRPSPADIGAISVSELTGIPLPWPQASVPSGWLKCNGQAFDKNLYPRLAQVYPSGVLPDLRGEFIRGWDDGRGVDEGRVLGSLQAGTYITGDNGNTPAVQGIGNLQECNADKPDSIARSIYWMATSNTQESIGSPYWGVTRPRNIAFNYIVRAA
ncbi:phage tail protein [Dickeya zeae]|uniref:Tail Collar domain protein n=1 Tax=Dickeya zeae (strain Ech586) TaxID=590409 RepID=D2BZF0_DICZ5|nr:MULTISPECIES: phage tail protein [Dickeya]ACZ78822.1 Tail Collar domain protein [Dickeya parazeae Ech586]UCZ77487.1 phage tail protein [Dickeya zeae]